jgi:hypothetical protein
MVREIVQNSADAGASKIDFEVTDGRLVASDNGSGLTVDQFQERMLTLGASEKEVGAVGGFGAAKKVLLFAHNEWSVTGQRFKATGRFHTEIKTVDGHRSRGLQIEVKSDLIIADDVEYQLTNMLSRSRIKATVTYNGATVAQGRSLRKNQIAHVFEFGTLYVHKGDPNHSDYNEITGRLVVRTNGMFTLNNSVGTPFTWYLEIDGCETPSIDVLTESRDHLRWEVRERVFEYIASVQTSGKTEAQPTSTVDVFGISLDEEGIIDHPEAGEMQVNNHGPKDDREENPYEEVDTKSRAAVREWDMDGDPITREGDPDDFISEAGDPGAMIGGQYVPDELLQQARAVGGDIGQQIDKLQELMQEASTPEPEVCDPWRAPFAIMADGVNPKCFDESGALKPKAARAMEIVYQSLTLVSEVLGIERPIPALIYGNEAEGRCLNGGRRSVVGINISKVDTTPFELLDVILHELAHIAQSGHDLWFLEEKERLASEIGKAAMAVLTQLVAIQAQKRQPARYWQ